MMDLEGHRGLRGLLAVWVMVFHCVFFTKSPLDLQGSSLMPMFIMLSGFSLTVAYGKDSTAEYQQVNTLGHEEEANINSHQETVVRKPIDFLNFYRNRLVRIIPVYYLCSLAAIPLWLAGYGSASPHSSYFLMSIATTFLPVCTFFIFLLGSSLDGPGWTVCTLLVMYIFFPSLLKHVKSLNNEGLQNGMINLYWIQMAILFAAFFLIIPFLGFWPAFGAATMQPISRLPLFIMGMYAGELCARTNDGVLSWQGGYFFLFPCCCGAGPSSEHSSKLLQNDQKFWTQRTDYVGLAALAITLIVFAGDTADRLGSSGGGILGGVWLQAIVPYMHLELMVGLTRDQGQSVLSKLLRWNVMAYLGDLSMCIYLIHFVVLKYVCWFSYGSPVDLDIDDYADKTALPVSGIVIVPAISLILAVFVFHNVEEPCRKALKK